MHQHTPFSRWYFTSPEFYVHVSGCLWLCIYCFLMCCLLCMMTIYILYQQFNKKNVKPWGTLQFILTLHWFASSYYFCNNVLYFRSIYLSVPDSTQFLVMTWYFFMPVWNDYIHRRIDSHALFYHCCVNETLFLCLLTMEKLPWNLKSCMTASWDSHFYCMWFPLIIFNIVLI